MSSLPRVVREWMGSLARFGFLLRSRVFWVPRARGRCAESDGGWACGFPSLSLSPPLRPSVLVCVYLCAYVFTIYTTCRYLSIVLCVCVYCYTVVFIFMCAPRAAACARRVAGAVGSRAAGSESSAGGLGCQPTIAGLPDEGCPLGAERGGGWGGVCFFSFAFPWAGLCISVCIFFHCIYDLNIFVYCFMYECLPLYCSFDILCARSARLGALAGAGAVMVGRDSGLLVKNCGACFWSLNSSLFH